MMLFLTDNGRPLRRGRGLKYRTKTKQQRRISRPLRRGRGLKYFTIREVKLYEVVAPYAGGVD